MVSYSTILLLLFSLFISIFSQNNSSQTEELKSKETPNENGTLIIRSLNKQSFSELRKNQEDMIVLYYTPENNNCKKFYPEYRNFAKEVIKQNISVIVGKVNCKNNTALCEAEKVKVYPLLKMYHGKETKDYVQDKITQDMINAVEKFIYPSVRNVTKTEEINFLVKKRKKYALVYTNDPSKSQEFNEEYKIFSDFAKKNPLTDHIYLLCHSPECEDIYLSDIVYLRPFDDSFVQFDASKINDKTIDKFILSYIFPLAGPTNDDLINLCFTKYKPFMIYFRHNSSDAEVKKYSVLREVHQSWRKHLTIFVQDINGTEFTASCSRNFGVNEEDMPIIMIIQPTEKMYKKYIYPHQIMEDDLYEKLNAFVSDFYSQKLKESPLTEAIPLKQPKGFKIIVSKNFKKEILETEESILLFCVNEDDGIYYNLLWKTLINWSSKRGVKLGRYSTISNQNEFKKENSTEFMIFLKNKKDKPEHYKLKNAANNKDIKDLIKWASGKFGIKSESEKEIENIIKKTQQDMDREFFNRMSEEERKRWEQIMKTLEKEKKKDL